MAIWSSISISMNELLRKRAIAVMNKLMSHPSAKPFIAIPENEDRHGSSIDLGSILSSLREKKYKKFDCWLADVEQCWTNAERKRAANPGDSDASYEYALAEQNRRIFAKEMHYIEMLYPQKWGTEIVKLRSRIAEIMSDPPPKVRIGAPSIKAIIAKQCHGQIFSEHEMQCFVEAAEKMETDEQNTEMTKIITELQPDLLDNSSDNYFDVSKLRAITFNALRAYVKAELEKIGQKYPE